MIQLRKQDVRKDQDGWVMRLTPEAGGIKNNTFRDVPVHQHLIALGFLDLVERAKDGPLFCEIGKDGTTTGPAEGVYKRILEVVRSVVPDPKVQPNRYYQRCFVMSRRSTRRQANRLLAWQLMWWRRDFADGFFEQEI